MRAVARNWFPVIAWTAVILAASSDAFAARDTGSLLASIIRSLTGRDLAADHFAVLHLAIRKAAHVVEYGILAALALRALRNGRAWSWRTAAGAVAIAAAVAVVDEVSQSRIASRTGSPVDVTIDTAGATAAVLLAGAVSRRRVSER